MKHQLFSNWKMSSDTHPCRSLGALSYDPRSGDPGPTLGCHNQGPAVGQMGSKPIHPTLAIAFSHRLDTVGTDGLGGFLNP